MLKLWKGLFYALWMCDRPIPQQTLCADLAGLVYLVPREAVVPWLRAFWATMSREWTGIDVLRMEKFLLLVRRIVGVGFEWMKLATGAQGSGRWDGAKVNDVLGLLSEWPFAVEDEARIRQDLGLSAQDTPAPLNVPVGLRIHVLDIWVDEAEKAGVLEDADEAGQDIMQRITGLVDLLERQTTSKAVRIRAKESLEDPRLPANRGAAHQSCDVMTAAADNESWDGFDD
jgi:ribosomal RNA-processing protein 1